MTADRCTCAGPNGAHPIDLSLLKPVLERFADDEGALIPVLQGAQDVFGYLPKPALAEIAAKRGVPLATVYGVATFYSQFNLQPQGRTLVKLCQGTACHVSGASEVAAAITEELGVGVGETSEDMRFSVGAVACVGCCGLAPVVVAGERTHGSLDPARARKLAKRLLREAPE